MWATGARTIQMNKIPAHSIPDFVTVTPDGTLVDSLAPHVLGSDAAAQLVEHVMAFSSKPHAGGFGFAVLSDTLNSGIYIACDVEAQWLTAQARSTTLDKVMQSATLPVNASISLHLAGNVEPSARYGSHAEDKGIYQRRPGDKHIADRAASCFLWPRSFRWSSHSVPRSIRVYSDRRASVLQRADGQVVPPQFLHGE